MKLQIISRLSKYESSKEGTNRQNILYSGLSTAESTDRNEKMSQYYSVSTESSCIATQKQTDKINLQDFFNQFNANCQVRYKAVEGKPKEVKRKLAPLLQEMKLTQYNSKIQPSPPPPQSILNQPPMTFNLNPWMGEPKPSHLQADPKQTYYFQRAQQKIRKVNSLIDLDNQRTSMNSNGSTRKPGFIRLNRSLAKKESSLHLSKIADPTRQSTQNSQKGGNSKSILKSGGKMQQQIHESKQRIAKIRRELNQIYQMRHRPMECKLRLS